MIPKGDQDRQKGTSYEEALSRILEHVSVMDAEECPVRSSLGRVSAEDVFSGVSLPQTATVRPDGYALYSEDIACASRKSPATLTICETVRAGILPRKAISPGMAARVMTGSVLPPGADCVVPFEDTDEPAQKCGPNPNSPSAVKVYVNVEPGANIQPAGSAVKEGAKVISKGTVLGPSQISALTSIGRLRIAVHRRPVVAIISTGDELIPAG